MNVIDRITSTSIPRQLAQKKYIDFVNLSEGQTLLSLIDRRIDLHSAFTGDPTGDYQKAKNLVYQASRDLHGLRPVFTGSLGKIEQVVARYIKRSASQINNFNPNFLSNRLGTGLVPEIDCDRLATAKAESKFTSAQLDDIYDSDPHDQPPRLSPYYSQYQKIRSKALKECAKAIRIRNILNDKWENAGPHMLYEFISISQQKKGITDVATKKIFHKNALSQISKIGGEFLTRDNLREWTYNGVLAQNIAEDIGDLTPSETIDFLILGGNNYTDNDITSVNFNNARLGERPSLGLTLTIPVLIKIGKFISILISAYLSTRTILDLMKQNELLLEQKLDSMGFPEISADVLDFWTDRNPQSQSDSIKGIGLLIGAAAAFYFAPKLLKP